MARDQVVQVRLLDAGRHLHPSRGGCLLELVSTLPGGPWNACPASVPPGLATLARAVNDATSSAKRPALAQLIPWLAALPATDATHAARLVATTTRAALAPAVTDIADRLRADAAAATEAVHKTGVTGWWMRRSRRREAIRTAKTAVPAIYNTGGDEAVRQLLINAINAVRQAHSLPPLPLLNRPAEQCAVRLAVRCEQRAAPGADYAYLHCGAVIKSWPDWLRVPWSELLAAQTTPPPRAAGRSG